MRGYLGQDVVAGADADEVVVRDDGQGPDAVLEQKARYSHDIRVGVTVCTSRVMIWSAVFPSARSGPGLERFAARRQKFSFHSDDRSCLVNRGSRHRGGSVRRGKANPTGRWGLGVAAHAAAQRPTGGAGDPRHALSRGGDEVGADEADVGHAQGRAAVRADPHDR